MAQENGPLKRSDFKSTAAWEVYDSASKKLRSGDRSKYTYKKFSQYALFPRSRDLQHKEAVWQSSFKEVQAPKEVSGKILSVAGSGAEVGDIVLMSRSGLEPLVMVYVGEHRFPDSSRPLSFFI